MWWDDQSALWVSEPQDWSEEHETYEEAWGYAILSAGGDDPNTQRPPHGGLGPVEDETNDRSDANEQDGDGPDEGPPSFQ